jgi:hypothetical protein
MRHSNASWARARLSLSEDFKLCSSSACFSGFGMSRLSLVRFCRNVQLPKRRAAPSICSSLMVGRSLALRRSGVEYSRSSDSTAFRFSPTATSFDRAADLPAHPHIGEVLSWKWNWDWKGGEKGGVFRVCHAPFAVAPSGRIRQRRLINQPWVGPFGPTQGKRRKIPYAESVEGPRKCMTASQRARAHGHSGKRRPLWQRREFEVKRQARAASVEQMPSLKFPSPASRARVHIVNSDRNGKRQNVHTACTLPPFRFPWESGLGWIRARLPAFHDSSIRSEGEKDAQNVLWSKPSAHRD